MGKGRTKSCLPAASLRNDHREKGRGSSSGSGRVSRAASGARGRGFSEEILLVDKKDGGDIDVAAIVELVTSIVSAALDDNIVSFFFFVDFVFVFLRERFSSEGSFVSASADDEDEVGKRPIVVGLAGGRKNLAGFSSLFCPL